MARATTDERVTRQFIAELAAAYHRGPAQQVKRQIQLNAPVLTGVMRQEHTTRHDKRDDGHHIIFAAEARSKEGFPYPIAVHNGRGVVRPVRAKALRWVDRAGVVVFAKRSGPSKPNPWMWRTFVQIGFRNVTRPNRRA